jgi:hypothetical protein
MLRAFIILIMALLPAWAQTPAVEQPKAPPGVEEALRARVNEFYQLQVEGKFRAAEKYVCESSQETYYASDKSQWLSKEIKRIDFKDDFTKADVQIAFETEASTPFGRIKMKSVLPSPWNFEQGAWCHFMPDPSKVLSKKTPFGTMSAKPPAPGKPAAPTPGKGVAASTVRSSVAANRTTLRIKGYEASSDEVEIVNGLAGVISLQMKEPNFPGLTVTLSAQQLKSKEKAQVKVKYVPQERAPKAVCKIPIQVVPTGQKIILTVKFDAIMDTEAVQSVPAVAPVKKGK